MIDSAYIRRCAPIIAVAAVVQQCAVICCAYAVMRVSAVTHRCEPVYHVAQDATISDAYAVMLMFFLGRYSYGTGGHSTYTPSSRASVGFLLCACSSSRRCATHHFIHDVPTPHRHADVVCSKIRLAATRRCTAVARTMCSRYHVPVCRFMILMTVCGFLI